MTNNYIKDIAAVVGAFVISCVWLLLGYLSGCVFFEPSMTVPALLTGMTFCVILFGYIISKD